jgi:hypothetical protein
MWLARSMVESVKGKINRHSQGFDRGTLLITGTEKAQNGPMQCCTRAKS